MEPEITTWQKFPMEGKPVQNKDSGQKIEMGLKN